MVFLIPAGGQGEKLWPYSRRNFPKTFQKLFGDKSLMQKTVDTLLKITKPENIFISTKSMYLNIAQKDVPEIPKGNYFVEPNFLKNRGPGEGYAFMMLTVLRPDEPFLIVQPDCIREPEERFIEMINSMEKIVISEKKFMSGGIPTKDPIMGVDFLSLAKKINLKTNLDIYSVKDYVPRKESYKETKELVENNNISIHSNHNCWYPELILKAYKKYRPDWYEGLMEIKKYIGKPNEREKTNEIYEKFEAGATEEVTKHVFKEGYIVNLPFKWYDMGTWESVYLYLNRDNRYKPEGNVIAIDTKDSLIKTHEGKLVATLGVKELVIVETEDVVLVADRKNVADVKKILQKIEEEKKDKYL